MAITIKKNKKAAFFTIISIVLVTSLIFFYTSSQKYSLEEQSKVIEIRILTMDSFIEDIEHDIERGLYISSMRSLIGMAEFMTKNGSFIPGFPASFNEIMLNGTIKGSIINITENATFGNWTKKIVDIGKKLNIDVEFSDLYLTPFHEDPWNVKVNVFGRINLTDRKEVASWCRDLNVTTTINIIDFEDPIYTVTSAGKLINKVIKSNITDFVSGNDASNLITHANNSWYIASNFSPSFLMRFAGNLSPSPHGIESVVNVDNLQIIAPEIYKASSSSIDYIYLGNSSISNCKVNETKTNISWFRLDNNHLNIYEANCES
ncbi:MAG: hypothetical protein KAK00_10140 [Nanoarchaeota archaeon]|nr:hypothetical protein [Nanoarchaeota archaeon]